MIKVASRQVGRGGNNNKVAGFHIHVDDVIRLIS